MACICSLCSEPKTAIEGELHAQIKALREGRGWTQERLAEECGTKQSRISLLESGQCEHLPNVETLAKLARAFGRKLVVRFE